MEHLKMHSLNKIDENVSKIAALFPNCVTEAKTDDGSITNKIDFDMLKQELSNTLVEGREERYQFTWPDKKQAILTANAPINKTLRPCREESVNFDTTENLYIEGDNLEVLKLLQETYLGKIKMIYIDPPYNTGNDFVYEDDFAQNATDYIANSGQTDGNGNRLVVNPENNGRFHTDWLNMMYPRLKLARDLLSDDGVIFISIDENEIENLKKIGNEIFGNSNLITDFIWRKKTGGGQTTEHFAIEHEYILLYAKDSSKFKVNYETEAFDESTFNKVVNGKKASIMKLEMWGTAPYKEDRPSLYYPIKDPNGNDFYPKAPDGRDGRWRKKPETLDNDHIFWQESKGILSPYEVTYYEEVKDKRKIIMPRTIFYDLVENTAATKELIALLGGRSIFPYSKPVKLISQLTRYATDENSIVLDFFSGSATTAHTVMNLNAEDGGKRKFIMVQLPEICDEKSEAYKAGYKNICEIGKERIRRAGKKIKEESPLTTKDLDIGFRVLKIDSTNMEDVYYTPDHIDTNDLFKNNIKSDRTGEDLLFQTMLDLGILLSSKIVTKKINGKEVFCVEGNYLMACFDDSVDEKTITEIAKEKPYYFVMRDPANSKDGDSLITNFEQIFTTYSPDTVRKVL